MAATPQSTGPVVDLILEIAPAQVGRVTVDTSFPIVDQAFGSGSGSGWRLFEPVPGEEPPWMPIGDAVGNTYRQRRVLPRSDDAVTWAAVCQVTLSWTTDLPSGERVETSTTVDGSVPFTFPVDGHRTVVCVLDHQEAAQRTPGTWHLSLR